MKLALGGLSLIFLSVCALGCGDSAFPDPVAVSGVVKLNGNPVEGATVTFLTKDGDGRSATGKTNAQGEFQLTTFSSDDGAIPGDYNVTITKVSSTVAADDIDIAGGDDPGDAYGKLMDAAGSDNADMSKVQSSAIPAKYGNAAESGLARTVAPTGKNQFGFDLE